MGAGGRVDSRFCVLQARQTCHAVLQPERNESPSFLHQQRGKFSPSLLHKDESLVATFVLILVPFEMLVGHLRVFSVFTVEGETGRLSLVLVAHVRDFLLLATFLLVTFPVALLWFFCVVLWLCRGPCLFWTKKFFFYFCYGFFVALVFLFVALVLGKLHAYLP